MRSTLVTGRVAGIEPSSGSPCASSRLRCWLQERPASPDRGATIDGRGGVVRAPSGFGPPSRHYRGLWGFGAPAERGITAATPIAVVRGELHDNVLTTIDPEYGVFTRGSKGLPRKVNRPSYKAERRVHAQRRIYANGVAGTTPWRSEFVATGPYRGAAGITVDGGDSFALNRTSPIRTLKGSPGADRDLYNMFTPGRPGR